MFCSSVKLILSLIAVWCYADIIFFQVDIILFKLSDVFIFIKEERNNRT